MTPAQALAEADRITRQTARELALANWHARGEYARGFADGRACACVALAEIEDRYQSIAHFREWAATLKRIIQAETDPSARMRQVMAEIAADQKRLRDARVKLATEPWTLSPLEWCALRRVRLADPGDAV